MTNQEAFDVVVNGLRKQGEKSVNKKGNCKLRGTGGKKCAIGMLIPNEQYTPKMENLSVRSIYDKFPKLKGVAWYLLEDLINIHDREQVTDWEEGFKVVAKRFGLNYVAQKN